MSLLKESIQRNGNGKLSAETKKKILSVIFAGIMAGSSAGVMAGCELSKGFQGLVDGLKTVTVTDPNGKKVTITVGKVNKTLENLPEMLKMAADPSYVNENVEKIDDDTLVEFLAAYSLDYTLDGFGVFNEENLNLLQQALPEQKNEKLIYVTFPFPRDEVGFNGMLYSILVEQMYLRIIYGDKSTFDKLIALNIKFLVPKSIETRDVGGKDLEYVKYHSCCGTEHDNEMHYNEDGSCYGYSYPVTAFYNFQEYNNYTSGKGVTINYCEHTKPLFDALQDERVLEK